MADMTLACDSVIVVNPPSPRFVIARPEPEVHEISSPTFAVQVINPPEVRVKSTPVSSTTIVLPIGGPRGPAGEDGTGGGGGSAIMSDQAVNETPDGSREVFTTTTPFIPSSLMVFLNGLMEQHIVRLSTTSFQFTTPPEPGDSISLTFSPA